MSELINHHKVNLYAILLMIVATMIGRFFLVGSFESSLIWPAIGVAFAFTITKRTAIFPALFIGSVLGYLMALSIGQGLSGLVILIAFLQSFVLIANMFFTLWLWDRLTIGDDLNFINLFKVFLVVLLVPLFAGFIGNGIYLILGMSVIETIFENFFIWMLGDIFGLLLFGLPYYLALRFDEDPYFVRWQWHEVIFYLVFIAVAMIMLGNGIVVITFEQHRYVFIVFAIIMAFNYGYRTPFAFSSMTLLFFVIWPPVFTSLGDYYYIIGVNLFLAVLTMIVLIIKYFIDSLHIRNKELIVKSERLDKLIEAAQDLLTLSSDLATVDTERIDMQAKKIFSTVYTLFNKADYGSCMIIDERLRFIETRGFDIHTLNAMPYHVDEWTHIDEPIVIRDTERFIKDELGEFYPVYHEKNPEIKESIFLSIHFTESLVCTLSFDLAIDSEKRFDDDDLMYFQSMQKLLNGVFKTDQLISDYEHTKDELITTLVRTIKVFDSHTMEHSLDVAEMAKTIAMHSELSEETVNNLYWAGIMHDIGKLGLPKDIVTKQGALTVAEFEIMKQHPKLGFEAIVGSKELNPIAEYVLCHHERLDGSGYPEGMSGHRISLPMEILAMAEVIATMVKEQSYSHQKPKAVIVNELREMAGVMFSKEVVRITLKAIQHGLIDIFY